MTHTKIAYVVAALAIGAFSGPSHAVELKAGSVNTATTRLQCTDSRGTTTIFTDNDKSPFADKEGYTQYNQSCQALIDTHWPRFQMQRVHWNEGWGFDDACNVTLPLNRTLRALEAIRISGFPFDTLETKLVPEGISGLEDEFFYLRAANKTLGIGIEVLKSTCSGERNQAATHDDWSHDVTLFLKVFDSPVTKLADTLVHESIHYWKPHNGGSRCAKQMSCDSSYEYAGANAHQLSWAWSYSQIGAKTNKFLRTTALERAKTIANTAFVTAPDFVFPNSVPDLPTGW